MNYNEKIFILMFNPQKDIIIFKNSITGKVIFSLPAHNKTVSIEGNPLKVGSFAPAPKGFLTLSKPDFISYKYQMEFYEKFFNSPPSENNETYVCRWGDFEEEEMGKIRFALGSPKAPKSFYDCIAWERELLIHSGKTFNTPTHGCIRMKEEDIERFTRYWIEYFKKKILINTIYINNI